MEIHPFIECINTLFLFIVRSNCDTDVLWLIESFIHSRVSGLFPVWEYFKYNFHKHLCSGFYVSISISLGQISKHASAGFTQWLYV
jgi:hypothetical protein